MCPNSAALLAGCRCGGKWGPPWFGAVSASRRSSGPAECRQSNRRPVVRVVGSLSVVQQAVIDAKADCSEHPRVNRQLANLPRTLICTFGHRGTGASPEFAFNPPRQFVMKGRLWVSGKRLAGRRATAMRSNLGARSPRREWLVSVQPRHRRTHRLPVGVAHFGHCHARPHRLTRWKAGIRTRFLPGLSDCSAEASTAVRKPWRPCESSQCHGLVHRQ